MRKANAFSTCFYTVFLLCDFLVEASFMMFVIP